MNILKLSMKKTLYLSNFFNNIFAIATASSAFLSEFNRLAHESEEARRAAIKWTEAFLTNSSSSKDPFSVVIIFVFAIA